MVTEEENIEKYSIYQVAEKLEVSDSSIRRWEKELDLTIPRDERRRRFYTNKEIEILTLINTFKQEDVPISKIEKELLKKGFIQRQQLATMQSISPSELSAEKFLNLLEERVADQVEKQVASLREDFKKELVTTSSIIKAELEETKELNKKLLVKIEELSKNQITQTEQEKQVTSLREDIKKELAITLTKNKIESDQTKETNKALLVKIEELSKNQKVQTEQNRKLQEYLENKEQENKQKLENKKWYQLWK